MGDTATPSCPTPLGRIRRGNENKPPDVRIYDKSIPNNPS